MTDNEIIKALECCNDGIVWCEECPYHENDCEMRLLIDTLDLINRQKAENSNLTSHLTSLQNDLTSAKAEIERLNNITSASAISIMADIVIEVEKKKPKFIHEIKAEAIKEFAERLKEKYSQADILCPRRIVSLTEKDLDNLIEETAGEDNE